MGKVKRTYQSKLRTEQTEATRRRILEAARLLFARQGYQDTTVDQLAEEAGVAIQTLYAAFGSKLNLGAAVVHDVLASIGIPEMNRQAGEIVDVEQALHYAAHVNRLVAEHLLELDALLSVSDLRDIAQVSDRAREGSISGLVATVIRSPRCRQDLSEREIRDTVLALTTPILYRMLVKDHSWSPDAYERWLGDLLISALLRYSRL